jgi:hypothetical protein
MRFIADTAPATIGTSWRRHVVTGLTLVISFSLVAAVAPARSRDRGTRGSRSVASRASCGSQRWDVHHDDGYELPLHVTVAESHLTNARAVTSGSRPDEGPGDDAFEPGQVSSEAPFRFRSAFAVPLVPAAPIDSGALRLSRSRAPPQA